MNERERCVLTDKRTQNDSDEYTRPVRAKHLNYNTFTSGIPHEHCRLELQLPVKKSSLTRSGLRTAGERAPGEAIEQRQ